MFRPVQNQKVSVKDLGLGGDATTKSGSGYNSSTSTKSGSGYNSSSSLKSSGSAGSAGAGSGSGNDNYGVGAYYISDNDGVGASTNAHYISDNNKQFGVYNRTIYGLNDNKYYTSDTEHSIR